MVHGLETIKKLNDEAGKVTKFALVSTVDSMGKGFPSHCVILFENERDALLYACKVIVEHDKSVQWLEDECQWLIDDEHYEDPADLLDCWQGGLDACEYFHVKPVVSCLT